MTISKTIGYYNIEIKKVNVVATWWENIFHIVGALLGSFILVYSVLYLGEFQFVGMCFAFITTLVLFYIPRKYRKCGIEISLSEDSRFDKYSQRHLVRIERFQIGEDPELDALKLKKILKEYEDYSNAAMKYENEESAIIKDREHQCCEKYKNVIKKIEIE